MDYQRLAGIAGELNFIPPIPCQFLRNRARPKLALMGGFACGPLSPDLPLKLPNHTSVVTIFICLRQEMLTQERANQKKQNMYLQLKNMVYVIYQDLKR